MVASLAAAQQLSRGERVFWDGAIASTNGLAFRDNGKVVYFTNTVAEQDAEGRSRVRLFTTRLNHDGWSRPIPLTISTAFNDYQPTISRDGKWLFFTSTRPLPGGTKEVRQNVWYAPWDRYQWGPPRLAVRLSSPYWDGHAVLAPDGTLYFASDRPGGKGMVDIYRSRFNGGNFGPPEPVDELNSEITDNDMALSSDGRMMVITRYDPASSDTDLYMSFWRRGSWTEPAPMGSVNTYEWELSPVFSPDGRSLLFMRRGTVGFIEVPLARVMPRIGGR